MDDAELVAQIKNRINDAPMHTEHMLDAAAYRIDALTARLAKAEALAEALRDIGVYGCGMLSQPAALNEPNEAWLRRRVDRMERVARAALAAWEATPPASP